MDFDSIFNPPPIIQEKKKYTNFTVREIGGPVEVEAYRLKQRIKEEAYQMKLLARDERLGAFEKETGQKLVTPALGKASWAEKLVFAKSERERLRKPELYNPDPSSFERDPEPPKTIIQRMTGFIKRIWDNAKF